MSKISLVSPKTRQSPIQNGKMFNNTPKITTVKVPQDIDTPSQTSLNREKKIKSTYNNKQQLAIVPEVVYGRILEIKKNIVAIRCLIDEKEQLFEIKRFDKKLLKGTVNLVINQLVEIKIYMSQGEAKYILANSNRQDLAEKFKPKDYFSKYEGSVFFQPLPKHIDEDNF